MVIPDIFLGFLLCISPVLFLKKPPRFSGAAFSFYRMIQPPSSVAMRVVL